MMRISVSLPDRLAERFLARVPPRQRSATIARLLEHELEEREKDLADACRAANKDAALERDVEDWQAFDDELGGPGA